MDEQTKAIILRVIERVPQWIRHDLDAKDVAVRARAEETLAAMIGNALDGGTGETSKSEGQSL
ncbi:hypothetical protein DM806_03175 [Sphingobium lactosutens]|uniref:hypothetical protein n=1 Tax=Sphingobium lactosutens TaxID=522773 RepID=UPI0015C01D8E|nr:hypothetical protein [Sphingobium lactosutens]NWK94682.1 hypothetical protein [Sphingobium lactosutens]